MRTVVTAAIVTAIFVGACGATTPSSSARPSTAALAADVTTYRGDPGRSGSMPGPGPASTPRLSHGRSKRARRSGRRRWSSAMRSWSRTAMGRSIRSPSRQASSGGPSSSARRRPARPSPTRAVSSSETMRAPDGAAPHGRTSVWTADLDGAISGSPASAGERIIAASGSGTAYGLDAATGAVAWSTPLWCRHHQVHRHDRRHRVSRRQRRRPGGARRRRWLDPLAGGGRRERRDRHSGSRRQSRLAATGIDMDDPTAKAMTAIDVATGAVRWRYASPDQVQVYTAAVVGGQAFIVGEDGRVVAVDAQTGRPPGRSRRHPHRTGVAVGGRRDRLRRRRRWSGDRARRGDGEHSLDRPGRGHPVRANGRAGIPVGRRISAPCTRSAGRLDDDRDAPTASHRAASHA